VPHPTGPERLLEALLEEQRAAQLVRRFTIGPRALQRWAREHLGVRELVAFARFPT